MLTGSLSRTARKAADLIASGRLDLLAYRFAVASGLPLFAPAFPSILTVEPSNVCNLQCPLCPTGSGRLKRRPRMMTLTEFQCLVEQARGRSSLILLHFCGEPFLNRAIIPMVEYATRARIAVELSTNGMFFESEEFCMKLVGTGLRHLVVVLDGADQATLEKYRKGADFQVIVRGIDNVLRARTQAGSPSPTVELQFIVMRFNEHQRQEMHRLAKRLGVDLFTKKTLGMMGLPLADAVRKGLAETYLPRCEQHSRYSRSPDGSLQVKGPRRARCRPIHETAVILSDGTLVPCCYDADGEIPMGNVFSEELATVWHGHRFREFRRQVRRNRDGIAMCAECPEGRCALNVSREAIAREKMNTGSQG